MNEYIVRTDWDRYGNTFIYYVCRTGCYHGHAAAAIECNLWHSDPLKWAETQTEQVVFIDGKPVGILRDMRD